MRYPIVCLAGMMFMLGAYADNNNTATSKDYVDAQIETLQDEIPAIDTNTVLTHTGTSGEIGSKKIYDETADYASQTDALMTADTFNSAVQNAIDTEFVCIDWLGEHVPGNCLLWQIRAGTPKPSGKNLFDIKNAKVIKRSNNNLSETKTTTGYTLQSSSVGGWQFILIEFGNISDFIGKTLTLSTTHKCEYPRFQIGYSDNNGENRIGVDKSSLTVLPQNGGRTKIVFWLYLYSGNDHICDEYSNIQIEEGSVATEYEPYQNLYLPSGD